MDEKVIDVIQVDVNVKEIMETNLEGMNFDPDIMTVPVISDESVKGDRPCLKMRPFLPDT